MGTPAKQPIAVAVDQPPETSELPVELEAWASMAAYDAAAFRALVLLQSVFVQLRCSLATC